MKTQPSGSAQAPRNTLPPNSSHKLRTIMGLFVVIFFCFLILDNFRIETLTSIRAYVEGEGLWSKGQKESVLSLRRYAQSHDERDFRGYTEAIAIPLGDHQARAELEKEDPNYNLVDQGFLQGGNHPDDLEGMAKLFRRFRRVSYMSDAIKTWTQGDRYIDQLQAAAMALHEEIVSGRRDPTAIDSLIDRVDDIDNHLTPLENEFSDEMTLGSVMLSSYLSLFVFGTAGLLLVAGVIFSLRLSREIRQSEIDLETANESLKRSEKRFRSLIQDLSDVILVIAADGTLHYASNSANRVFGYAPQELTGQSIFSLLHADDTQQFRDCLERSVLQKDGTFATEFRFGRKDGTWIDLEATGNPMSDDGAIGRILITCRDVTERRRLEHELGQSQKMEAIGRLAGGIAHDFNNILMIIGGYAEIMTGRLHPDDPLRKLADSSLKAVARGAELTKRLLSFSRKQVMAPRNLDVNAVLEDMSKVLQRLLGAEVEVAIQPGANVGLVYTDPAQLEQVLINLAVNSRDAMPRGGTLTIATANVDFDDSNIPAQSFILPGSYVVLSITDTGCGMSADMRNHAFEPFYTTKESGKGTGLGLSIVYGIVKRSGGHIVLESEPNVGTSVRIYFPRVEGVLERVEPAAEPAKPETESGVVLLVEDEDSLRNMVSEFLKEKGYTVLSAASAAEALNELGRFGQPIDILVTDVIMPKMRGPELASKIKEKMPEVRVVYMSGHTGSSLVRDGILEFGTVLVQKPFSLQLLAKTIRETRSRVAT